MNRKNSVRCLSLFWGLGGMLSVYGNSTDPDTISVQSEEAFAVVPGRHSGESVKEGTGLAERVPFQVCLTLDQCREMALQNNVYVRNADLAVLAAQAQKREALASYFPQVSVSAFAFGALDPLLEIGITDVLGHSSFAENLQQIVEQYAPQLGLNSQFSTLKKGVVASVSAMQPIYVGGRIVNGNRLAKLGWEAAGLQRRMQVRSTEEEMEANYWQIISLEEKQKTLLQLQGLLDTLYRDVVSARSAGLATDNDLMQVDLKRNELKSGLIQVRNGIRLAKMNLFNGIGFRYNPYRSVRIDSVPYIDDVLFADTIGRLDPPDVYYIPEEEIAAGQEEMQLLELSVDAKRLEKKMTVGETLPQLGVGASYGYGNLIDKGDWNGAVYVMARIPISDWGGNARKIQRYEYRLQQAENERDYLGAQILLQIRQLWLNLTASWEQLAVAEESMETARSSAERLGEYYRAGLSPLSELLQAQTQLRQSIDSYIDQRIAYKTALQRYVNRARNGRDVSGEK